MMQRCSACLIDIEIWFHAQGLLCSDCSREYQALEARWKKKYRKQMDYVPFRVRGNFLRKKWKEARERKDKDST